MGDKPIWTFLGDIAIELEHALPHIKKAKIIAIENGDSGLEVKLYEIELRIKANLEYASNVNKVQSSEDTAEAEG